MPTEIEPNHDGWRHEFRNFLQELEIKVEQGAREYGNRSFDRPVAAILGKEIHEELLDICGWAFIANRRIKDLSAKAAMIERVLQKVDMPPDGCWLWKGSITGDGYGALRINVTRGKSKMVGAHRISYQLFKGDIPPNMLVRHRCDNPKCVNPEHLLLGTVQENATDRVQRGRSARGPRHGKYKHGRYSRFKPDLDSK